MITRRRAREVVHDPVPPLLRTRTANAPQVGLDHLLLVHLASHAALKLTVSTAMLFQMNLIG